MTQTHAEPCAQVDGCAWLRSCVPGMVLNLKGGADSRCHPLRPGRSDPTVRSEGKDTSRCWRKCRRWPRYRWPQLGRHRRRSWPRRVDRCVRGPVGLASRDLGGGASMASGCVRIHSYRTASSALRRSRRDDSQASVFEAA